MHQFQAVSRRPGRLMVLQSTEGAGFHGPVDGAQTVNALGMAGTGVVVQAGIMGVEAGGHAFAGLIFSQTRRRVRRNGTYNVVARQVFRATVLASECTLTSP